ncbi:MAG: SMC-Scp complex subunit ScpB [Bacteroidetes bacterium]|nr:SMC-Scp complex subunit ScpB [Bacteroidota bacterium]
MELLKQQVEALIFCSEQSISLDEIKASLKLSFEWELTDEEVIEAIEGIKSKYLSDDFAFELIEISEGYQFLTKKQYHPTINSLIQHKSKKKLSVSQMETLAIIAYRQPISKSEIEHIRGVSCDYAVQKLLEKELVEISGKSDGPGRPVLYSTSRNFMDYFGIKNVKDLPQLKDLHVDGNEIGTATEMMDSSDLENAAPSENENPESDGNSIEIPENSEEVTALESAPEVEPDMSEIQEISMESEELADAEEVMEIPDRKAIYLENEHNVEAIDENAEIKNENEEE